MVDYDVWWTMICGGLTCMIYSMVWYVEAVSDKIALKGRIVGNFVAS